MQTTVLKLLTGHWKETLRDNLQAVLHLTKQSTKKSTTQLATRQI